MKRTFLIATLALALPAMAQVTMPPNKEPVPSPSDLRGATGAAGGTTSDTTKAGPTDNPNVSRDAQGRTHVNKGKHKGEKKNKKKSVEQSSTKSDKDTTAAGATAKGSAGASAGAGSSAAGGTSAGTSAGGSAAAGTQSGVKPESTTQQTPPRAGTSDSGLPPQEKTK